MFKIRSFAKSAFAGNKALLGEFPEGMASPQADQERRNERRYKSANTDRAACSIGGAAAATDKISFE